MPSAPPSRPPRRPAALIAVVAAIAGAALVLAGCRAAGGATVPDRPGDPAVVARSLRAGAPVDRLVLVSPHGRASVALDAGRLVVRRGGRTLWATPRAARGSRVQLTSAGDLRLWRGHHTVWSSGTRFPGATRLVVDDGGALAVVGAAGPVWTSRTGNGCTHGHGHRVIVDLGAQRARLCAGRVQLLDVAVTTGATRRGLATPTGRWRIQARQRDRRLRPGDGRSYFVHYWLPFHGDYGFHDAPWQRMPYGSARYRTDGSHGCVHLPLAAARFVYRWAGVGTAVIVRR